MLNIQPHPIAFPPFLFRQHFGTRPNARREGAKRLASHKDQIIGAFLANPADEDATLELIGYLLQQNDPAELLKFRLQIQRYHSRHLWPVCGLAAAAGFVTDFSTVIELSDPFSELTISPGATIRDPLIILMMMRGIAFYKFREWDKVLDCLGRTPFRELNDGTYIVACSYFFADQPEIALPLFEEAASKNPSSWTLAALGRAQAHLKKYKEAESSLTAAISMGVETEYAVRQTVYKELGKLDEAESDCRRAIQLDSKNAELYADLAEIMLYNKRYEEMLKVTQDGLALDPNHLNIDFLRTSALTGTGQIAKALQNASRLASLRDVEGLTALIRCIESDYENWANSSRDKKKAEGYVRETKENLTHPGSLIATELAAAGLSVAEAATKVGMTRNQLHRIIRGDSDITQQTALQLEANGLGPSAREWLILQIDFNLTRHEAGDVSRIGRPSARQPRSISTFRR